MVLATDGSASFAFFIYGALQFGDSSIIGFKRANMIYMPISSSATSVSFSSNVDITGVFLYRIDLKYILEANGMYSTFVAVDVMLV